MTSSQPPSPTSPDAAPSDLTSGDGDGGEVALLMARMQELKEANWESSQEDKAKHFADINLESCKRTSNEMRD